MRSGDAGPGGDSQLWVLGELVVDMPPVPTAADPPTRALDAARAAR